MAETRCRTRWWVWCLLLSLLFVSLGGCGWLNDDDDDEGPAPGVRVTLNLSASTVAPGGGETFVATVTGTSDTSVTWELDPGTCGGDAGSIAGGVYTTGSPVEDCEVTIRVACVADPSVTAEALVTVDAPIVVSLDLGAATVGPAGTQAFLATVTGSGSGSRTVTWSVQPGTCGSDAGSVSDAGVYTAGDPLDDCQVTVRATSAEDASKSAAATVVVDVPVSVYLDQTRATVAPGGSHPFVATVGGAGSGSTAVTWAVEAGTCGGDAGMVNVSGAYTAGNPVDDCQVTVRATSVEDGSKSATATVTVDAPVSVSLSPTAATVLAGGGQAFTAMVAGAGSGSTAVTWTVEAGTCGGDAGSVNASGTYTAGNPVDDCQIIVRVTSVADASKSAAATVNVDAPVGVTVAPASATLAPGGTQSFGALVTGTANAAVAWSLDSAGCGSIDAGSGLFSAGNPAASCQNTVRAMSLADGAASGTATVTVTTCVNATYTVTSTVDAVDANIGDNVCDDGSGNCTLRAAIQEANACAGPNTVDVAAGTYLLTIPGISEDAAATGDLDVTDELTILGSGAAATIIDGNSLDRVFHGIGPVPVTLVGATIQNGSANGYGGGVLAGGDLTITDAALTGNHATNHGGAVCDWGPGTITIANSTLSGNTSDSYGGAVFGGAGVSVGISDSTLSANVCSSYGAAVYGHTGSTIEIARSFLDGNTGLDANTAGWAAVVGMNNSAVVISESTVSNSGTATDPARSTGGVRVYTNSSLTISRSTITGNRGGGVSCSAGYMESCASLTVTDSAIEGNSGLAVGSYSFDGPGVYTTGPTTVTGSSISNNYVTATLGGTGAGGGIYAAADLTVANSTISGNLIPNNAAGGGIYFAGATGSLTNVSIVDNYALYGPGIRVQNNAATLTITNSILSGPWTGHAGNCTIGGGAIVSGGHNIDSANTCGFTAVGDLINTDPLLDVLADNTGPTQTRALLAGSPAIDAGDDAVCAAAPVNGVDQRGVSRPQGTHCDIGAYEYP